MRTLAGIQCALFAATLVGAHAHRAAVAHRYCSEHGDLIHAPDAPAGHQGIQSLEGTTRNTLRPHSHVEGGHGCSILQFLTQSTSLQADTAAHGPSPLQARQSSGSNDRTSSSIPLLLQSPKHSPPVRSLFGS